MSSKWYNCYRGALCWCNSDYNVIRKLVETNSHIKHKKEKEKERKGKKAKPKNINWANTISTEGLKPQVNECRMRSSKESQLQRYRKYTQDRYFKNILTDSQVPIRVWRGKMNPTSEISTSDLYSII